MEINRFCCEFVRDGKLGKIKQVSAVNYTKSKPINGLSEEPIPKGDDWSTWLGPTKLRPFNKQLQFLLDAMARLLRRRDDELGHTASIKSNGHSAKTTPVRPNSGLTDRKASSRCAPMAHPGPLRSAMAARWAALSSSRIANGNQPQQFTTNPPDFVKDAQPGSGR
jgi:hypothetical protein